MVSSCTLVGYETGIKLHFFMIILLLSFASLPFRSGLMGRCVAAFGLILSCTLS